jgi:hypothetical protein
MTIIILKNKFDRMMKLKLALYLSLYAAVIAFIAVGIKDPEAKLGQKMSLECKYDVLKDGGKRTKEYRLEINSKKIKETRDSVYIGLLIYNKGKEKLTLGPRNFVLMGKSDPICLLAADSSVIPPEQRKEIILGCPKSVGKAGYIDVVKYGGGKASQKLFSLKL